VGKFVKITLHQNSKGRCVCVVTGMEISKSDFFYPLTANLHTALHYEHYVNLYHKAFDARLEFIR